MGRAIFANILAKLAICSQIFDQKIEIRERLLMRFSFSPFRGLFWAGSFFPAFRIWIPKTVQRSALCRSRRELSHEYLLAKFGFDTAENEPDFWFARSPCTDRLRSQSSRLYVSCLPSVRQDVR